MTILRSIVRKSAYQAAYLFEGPSGVGKTTLGRIFAKAILCNTPADGEPCNECRSCKTFDLEQNFGYQELDAASYGGKEDMIKLRDDAVFSSVSRKRIILLDESHDISKQGQDALLKQIEQCPDHLIYMFCTTDADKMKDTLRNRCMEFQVSRVSSDLIVPRLEKICDDQNIEYDTAALDIIAHKSNGHVRNAINTLEETTYLGKISVDNVNTVLKDYDSDVYNILVNIGSDLKMSLEACGKLSHQISAREIFNMMLSMLSDTAKFLYNYNNFLPERKKYLIGLKDTYGFAIVEFLSYLIRRDKFVDDSGIQSDIILLHYKMSSNSFQPQTQIQAPSKKSTQSESSHETQKKTTQPASLRHEDLLKLDLCERAKVLRGYRKNRANEEKEQPARVPVEWPLLKEERLGESSEDDQELSPNEFSQLLVGGRRG